MLRLGHLALRRPLIVSKRISSASGRALIDDSTAHDFLFGDHFGKCSFELNFRDYENRKERNKLVYTGKI